MQALGKNGVLVLASVTVGDKMIQIPADRINLEFVLGNKVMVGTVNANREYFEMGVGDLAQAEAEYPGWLSKLLTDPVKGLDNYTELFQKLTSPNRAIKVFCEVAQTRTAGLEPGHAKACPSFLSLSGLNCVLQKEEQCKGAATHDSIW